MAAARPDAAVKTKYFAAWFDDASLPESWIEESVAPFNTVEQAALTAPYLARALARLPQLKRERKIFFVNNWLAAFLGGQVDGSSLAAAQGVLRAAKLDPDLRRKVLEAMDGLERTVRIRARFAHDAVPANAGTRGVSRRRAGPGVRRGDEPGATCTSPPSWQHRNGAWPAPRRAIVRRRHRRGRRTPGGEGGYGRHW